MALVVVLTGLKRSGKDYMLKRAQEAFDLRGVEVIRLSFSDQLREICHYIFPWLPADIEESIKDVPFDHPKNIHRLTPREIWKRVADDNTGICSIQPEVLVDFFNEKYSQILDDDEDHRVYIISDLRKLSEYELVKTAQFPIIRITDPAYNGPIDDVEKLIPLFEVEAEVENHFEEKSVLQFLTILEKVINERYKHE
jgi:hypothetical protein